MSNGLFSNISNPPKKNIKMNKTNNKNHLLPKNITFTILKYNTKHN